MSRPIRILIVLVATGAIAVGLTAVALARSSSAGHDLARAALATAKYHSVERALADGYVPGSPCEVSPDGGMGFHYVNPPLLMDPALDPARPEILLYAPRPNGKLRLIGVEYFKVDADQNLATADDKPAMFNKAFDGPMLGHAPGMPIHYDLHVWLWKWNPSGLFSMWNPRVTCS